MKERVAATEYRGEERRRRWPVLWPREERRTEPLTFLETDQEPDQSAPGLETIQRASIRPTVQKR